MRERSTLWIHSQVSKFHYISDRFCCDANEMCQFQIKACMEAVDCQPDFCLDLFEQNGHGRKRRSMLADQSTDNETKSETEYKRFRENIEYSVFLPGEFDQLKYQDQDQCKNFILISGLLAMLLTLSTILVSIFHVLYMIQFG